jgi:hypothetical protein
MVKLLIINVNLAYASKEGTRQYYTCGTKYHTLCTLNMIFSVTDYLDLHDAISIYCISHILQTNDNNYRTLTTLLGKKSHQ